MTARALSRRLSVAGCRAVAEFTLPTVDFTAYHVYVIWSRARPSDAHYVGKSIGVLSRIGQHLRRAAWGDDAGDVTLYEFATAEEMDDGEARLIRALRPSANEIVPQFDSDDRFMSWTYRRWPPTPAG